SSGSGDGSTKRKVPRVARRRSPSAPSLNTFGDGRKYDLRVPGVGRLERVQLPIRFKARSVLPSLLARADLAVLRLISSPSTGAPQKLALPCQRVAHDGLQVVKMRLPFEQRTGMIGSRHDLCRSPARRPANATSKSTPEIRFTVSITSSTEKPRP